MDLVAAAVAVVASAAVAVVAAAEAVAADATKIIRLRASLESRGLAFLGVVDLEVEKDFGRYQEWLASGFHASLAYLEKNQDIRKDASLVLPGAKRAVLFALPYGQSDSWPMPENENPRAALYSRFQDYHSLMRRLAEEAMAESNVTGRVCVDSVPLLERALASKTGKGFIGKNTCFIQPEWGSFLLLGEILTVEELPLVTEKAEENCGACTLCQVECPTGALNKDYTLDAGKCLSYWTIEQRGTIPYEYWPWLGKYWFGCDICQLVCPYNQSTKGLPESVPVRNYPALYEVATMDQKAYELYFGGTPLTRAKRNGLRRNALIAMCVTEDPLLSKALEASEGEGVIGETVVQISKFLSGQDEKVR